MSQPEASAENPPRQLITTLYGLYARDRDNWLSVAALVRMMGELGVDSAAVRSSVSRLKRRDVLRSIRRHDRAGYELAPATVEILREGDARIFDRRRATADDGWLVAVFSVPESEREKRHALRSQLARLGFGTAAPGVWVAPGTLYDEAAAALHRLDLQRYTEFFRGDFLGGSVADRVSEWWDLEEMERRYAQFRGRYAPVRRQLPARSTDPAEAFAVYVPMLTSWRRLPYLDPGLPLEHLPPGWIGVEAGKLFEELDARLRAPAAARARELLAE